MPPGIPVATMAIGGAKNAGLLAARILAVQNPELATKLDAFAEQQIALVAEMNATLND